MNNPWKLATIGLVLTGVTATASGLTTAYMLRPPTSAQAETAAPAAPAVARYAPAARYVPAAPAAPVRTATARTSTPRVVPVAASAPADCSTGTERAMRIAKPGALGALLGAGLGAAGGAIAGNAAGKGALIGGLAGAALGTGYGAYKTKNECGTILGNGFAGPASGTARADAPQSAFSRASGGEIQVYHAR